MARKPAPESHPALSEVTWELLLSLAGGERHGYSILLDVEERTEGRLQLLPGSLYRALHRLEDQGWVEEVDDAVAADQDARRRVCRLTRRGRAVAEAEARRLAAALRAARERGLVPGAEGH